MLLIILVRSDCDAYHGLSGLDAIDILEVKRFFSSREIRSDEGLTLETST